VKWRHTAKYGSVDFANDLFVRAGQTARLTSKRAGTSRLAPALRRFLKKWEEQDLREGFKFVLHDPHGNPVTGTLRARFNKVAKNGGLPWVKPHFLKHTGVTLCCYAGMGLPALADTFNTNKETLLDDYTHLSTFWTHGPIREFRPESLALRALKLVSPIPEGFCRFGGPLPK
jgi:integrase